jgi:hypothetical protein
MITNCRFSFDSNKSNQIFLTPICKLTKRNKKKLSDDDKISVIPNEKKPKTEINKITIHDVGKKEEHGTQRKNGLETFDVLHTHEKSANCLIKVGKNEKLEEFISDKEEENKTTDLFHFVVCSVSCTTQDPCQLCRSAIVSSLLLLLLLM